ILEIISKFAHLTAKSCVEQEVVSSSFVRSLWLVVNSGEGHASSYRYRDTFVTYSRIRDRKRVKRILYRHTDAEGAKTQAVRPLEWINRKVDSRQRPIKK